MQRIRIILADDHTVVRQGLKAILKSEADFEVIGEADNGRQAVALVAQPPAPDVVIMDVAMPFLNGAEATRQILRTCPRARVLVLSSYGDEDYVRQMIEAGAVGYLLKQTAADDLIKAIREVHRGHRFFSPAIAFSSGTPRDGRERPGSLGRGSPHLTSREAEVLQLIAEGFSNKQIADELAISIKTVEKHRQQVMNKLGIHEVAGLTRYAIARGMVERRTTTGI
jgi:DNA-binding NarL/FixJ family response regulator